MALADYHLWVWNCNKTFTYDYICNYRQTADKRGSLVGNKINDH